MLTLLRPARLGLLALALVLPSFPLTALETPILASGWTDAQDLAELPDGSLLVAQRSGLVDKLTKEGEGYRAPAPWADLGDGGRSTLLGLAVDPDFLSSGSIYAALYTPGPEAAVTLTRWREAGGSVVLSKVLADHLPGGSDRLGGILRVGPDRKLWLALGDGNAAAAEVTAESLRGTLLRYELDGTPAADNPVAGSPVWARGFRDPGALAWQPGTGRLYSLDRGPAVVKGTNDRLDVLVPGADLGWPKHSAREKARGYTQAVIYCSSGHSWIPTGAAFVPSGEWAGSLLFTGAGEGILYRLSLDAKQPAKILFYEELVGGDLGPLADVAAVGSSLFLLSHQKLYRLVP